MNKTTERQREIAQGLRKPSGELIGGLVVLDYVAGIKDFEAGKPPPDVSSTSYDLGRARALEKAEGTADMMVEIKRQNDESTRKVREMIAHRPDIVAEFDAKMARLEKRDG